MPDVRSTNSAYTNLAYSELRLVLAMLNRRFNFSLFKTTVDDVVIEHDLISVNARFGSKGVRVLVK